jgi:hypothetical protein
MLVKRSSAALFAVCLVAAALFAVAPASASTAYRYDNDLRWWVHNSLEQATYTDTHGKTIPRPVEVRCYTNRLAFELSFMLRGGDPYDARSVVAYYLHPSRGSAFYLGPNTIYMRAGTCALAREFVAGTYTARTVGAFTTLLHEALHRQGFVSERRTEAYAVAAMRAAGQLVQYNVYLANGADSDLAWDAAEPTGDKVERIAFDRANAMLAGNYHIAWSEVMAAQARGWAARIGL